MKKLSFFDRIIFWVNTVFFVLTLVSFVVPYIPVTLMPTISVLSLIVPLLVLVNLFFMLYWLIRRKNLFFMSGLLLLWSIGSESFFQLREGQKVNNSGNGILSVMSFNVRNFNKYGWIKNTELDDEILTFVKEQDPDILCFQEFRRIKAPLFKYYPYSFSTPWPNGKSYQTIFSKYPIVKGKSLDFPNTSNNAIYADIVYDKDTVRVYNVHLQSFRIVPEMNTIKRVESAKLLKISNKAMLKQYEQAQLIREDMQGSTYEKIITGDFNNTQHSNIYRNIRDDMQDTFLEKGNGFGRTYNLFGFPIRIDYILADSDFEILAHQNFNEKLSDHYPVMATLQLKSNQ